MSMGYAANQVIVIDEEEIEKLNLKTFPKLKEILHSNETSDQDLREILLEGSYHGEMANERVQEIEKIYLDFVLEFLKTTGVDIFLNYHDSTNDGDGYDEVDGLFFELSFTDIYEETEKAKELRKSVHFEAKTYVQYG